MKKKILTLFLFALILVSILFFINGCNNQNSNEIVALSDDMVDVHFIDVGQGDSIFIEYGDFQVLIDAGDNSAEEKVVDYLKKQKVDDLELFIATHSHADHIGGADAVLNAFDVEFIVDCEKLTDSKTFKDYAAGVNRNIKDNNTTVVGNDNNFILSINADGTKPEYVEDGDMVIKIIGNTINDDANNSSTVVLLDIKDTEFLFTGDLEKEGEKKLLNEFSDIDVLKLGHHGSDTASCNEFLNIVKPEYAVISCGKDNKYGHPHAETLQKLKQRKINTYRTDIQGTIVCSTDGKEIRWNTNDLLNDDESIVVEPKINGDENLTIIVDDKAETVTITNNSQDNVDLTGWKIVSVGGNQVYNFEDGYVLQGKSSVVVASGKANGDIKWTDKNIWSNSKPDEAQLIDNTGKLISSDD